ncbi:MAG TPA: hypothetical protein ENI58_06910 [Nitrospirae bacterium]|nr:hypothetical protein [Nitrospirota bacterium]
MIIDLLFYIGFALLLTHELDAIQRHEWRIFPITRKLKDEIAYYWFTILHVPLFVLLLWLMCHPSENIRFWFQISMDVFFIVHMVLHKLLSSHKNYEFVGVFSKAIIFSMGIVGIAHLSILLNVS